MCSIINRKFPALTQHIVCEWIYQAAGKKANAQSRTMDDPPGVTLNETD